MKRKQIVLFKHLFMIRLFKKSILFLVSGTFSIILAACYASQEPYTYYKKVHARTPDGQPIPGLKVTNTQNGVVVQTEFTDDAGIANMQRNTEAPSTIFKFEDVDSTQNLGHFESFEYSLDTLDVDTIYFYEVE
ncbi:MAG: hypothetical protein A2W91_11565 [Bacteroidetes bacterium GWF2_38_335]|nr:MAG: hypothetical protein A2W91_11565 [Bacteroidetes bacterium GWF2_38_335]OFY77917.1 MAG: hypothetical protein A2281_18310 [Bacteroidetes bacterium RIFOXYA12_FULL_38_20]HBS86657.1 hypothetical protein [Bacteroidales bacterium]